MDAAGESSAIANFIEATGAEAATARFFLESTNFDVPAALNAFFEAGEGGEHRARRTTDASGDDEDDDEDDDLPAGEEEEERPSSGPSGVPLAQRLLDSAEAVPPPRRDASRDSAQPPANRVRAFQGAGYSLAGGLVEPAAATSTPGAPTAGGAGGAAPTELRTRTVRLTFWRNGFTVDDGPLRDPADEESKAFLQSLEQKLLPPELRQLDEHGRPIRVEIQLADNRGKEYSLPPKPRFSAFGGEGRTLGGGGGSGGGEGGGSEVVVQAAPEPRAAPDAAAGGSLDDAAAPRAQAPAISVDESLPLTTLQLRLADGTRLRVRINLQHTVGELYDFVAAAVTGTRGRQRLLAGFPPKPLTEMSQTIEQAGLQGAAINQQLL